MSRSYADLTTGEERGLAKNLSGDGLSPACASYAEVSTELSFPVLDAGGFTVVWSFGGPMIESAA